MSGIDTPAGGEALTKDFARSLALAGAAALVFFALGAPLIPKAGMWYDEAVHSQIAINWMSSSDVNMGAGWPWWMKDGYQGSLKSVVLFTAFKAFGISAGTQRATTLGLGALSVFFACFFAARRYGIRCAAIFAPVMATSPGILLATCYDTGPVAMGVFLQSAGIFLLGEALLRRERSGWLLAAGAALGLGVWDKAHFLWILMAAIPGAFVLRSPSRGEAVNGRDAGALVLGMLVGAAPIIQFNISRPLYTFIHPGHQFGSLRGHLTRLPYWIGVRLEMAVAALTGTAPYSVSGGSPPMPWEAAVIPAIAVAALIVLARRRNWQSMREASFFLITAAGIFLIGCLAPLPVKWHHFPLLAAPLIFAAMSLVRQAFGIAPARRAVFGLAAMALVAAFGQIMFLRSFTAAVNAIGGADSTQYAARDLARWAQDHRRVNPDVRFFCDDWLDAPLMVFSGGIIRPVRPAEFMGSWKEQRLAMEAIADGKFVWLRRFPNPDFDSSMGPHDEALVGLMKDLPVETLAVFNDAKGQPWAVAQRAAAMRFSVLDAAWTRAVLRAGLNQDAGIWLDRAEFAARKGARDAALKSLTHAAKSIRDDTSLQRLILLCLKFKDHRPTALFLKRKTGNVDFWLAHAELEFGEGRRDAALQSLARAREIKGASDAQQSRIVKLYREMKEYPLARDLLWRLLPRRPQTAEMWLERAEIEMRTGERDAALTSLARIGDVDAVSDEQYLRVIGFYRELKEERRALATLRVLLQRRPQDAALWLQRSELEAQSGERDEGLRSLLRADASSLDDVGKRRAAVLYRRFQDIPRALAVLRPLLRSHPRDAGLWLDTAELAAQASRRDEALSALTRLEALKTSPDERRRMALLYRQMKEPSRALAALKPLLERLPADAELWLERAELEAQTNEKDAALRSLARAEASDPDGDGRRRLALNYQSLGEYGRAIAVLDRLIRQNPGEGTFYSDKGLCEHLNGDGDAAISSLEMAIKLKPDFVPAYLTLGAVHAAKGRHADAKKVYREGLARNPESEILSKEAR